MRSVDGSAWTLASVPGFELPAQPVATLRFEAGRATVTDSCNRYTTAFTRTGSQLQFGDKAAATLMACAPEVMQVANAVGAVLYDTRSYRIEFDTLTLFNADGKPLARLKEQANQLAGTSVAGHGREQRAPGRRRRARRHELDDGLRQRRQAQRFGRLQQLQCHLPGRRQRAEHRRRRPPRA